MRRLVTPTQKGPARTCSRVVSVMQRIPDMIVVPSHDQRAYAEMAQLPNEGLLR